jgi:amino acid adenylation domain-containing protein
VKKEADRMPESSERLAQLTPLQQAVLMLKETQAKLAALERARSEPIAIIGIGCRFPGGVESPSAFWQLLSSGGDAVREVPGDRWDVEAYYDPNSGSLGKMHTRWGGFLDEIDQFDAEFFGISPHEAARIDPQQRLLLEVAWHALEDAGLPSPKLAGTRTGVFVGISSGDFGQLQFQDAEQVDAFTGAGSALSIAANRLSYLWDLRGPSVAIDTACSSSLVAVHMACRTLRGGESDLALAAGVNLILRPAVSVAFSKAGMLSPRGRCRTFDAEADGYVRGEGCGVVILKRLSDAQADGDRILAILRGTAVNHGGRTNGLNAPSGLAQQQVIREALADAAIRAEQIDYVETHGTGTRLGDPIEVEAILAALQDGRDHQRPLVLGSVKTNVGHLEAAAGIAGLIKTILALRFEQIPPHLHLTKLNPLLAPDGAPIVIPNASRPWPRGQRRRYAGVSSFGFGGTNAHAILEEPPAEDSAASSVERPLHLVTLSAHSREALGDVAARLRDHLELFPSLSLAEVAYSANTARAHFGHRAAILANSLDALRERLRLLNDGEEIAEIRRGEIPGDQSPRIAFLFTGQGTHYAGMGRTLLETQPTFRRVLERCDAILQDHLGRSLLAVVRGEPGCETMLCQAAMAEPALFAVEYSLAEMWRSWGIQPSAVLGQDVGEFVAACFAGLFSLEDGLRLVIARGRCDEAPAPIRFTEPTIEIISNLTGEPAAAATVATPDYWRQHAQEPSQLTRGMRSLAELGCEVFVEIGPSPTLLAMGRRCQPAGFGTWLPTLRRDQEDWQTVLDTLAVLYTRGVKIDWSGFDRDYVRRRVDLPTYPFQRHRHWPAALSERRPTAITTSDDPARLSSERQDPARAPVATARAEKPEPDLIGRLRGVASSERQATILAYLRQQAAQLLGTESPAPDVSLNTLGFDSLMSLDLCNLLGQVTGKAVLPTVLLDYPTLAALSRYVAEELLPQESPKASDSERPITPPAPKPARRAISRTSEDQIPRVDRTQELPLSFAQERLWFLDQLEPASPLYNISAAMRLSGPLQAAVLNQCLQQVVARHEPLRTTFVNRQGRPWQRIAPRQEVPLPVLDLETIATDRREAEVQRMAAKEATRPFDLSTGPLIHTSLLRLGPTEHVLLFTVHHIVADGWSMQVLVRELVGRYEAAVTGRTLQLPELTVQYADYGAWQRERMSGKTLEEHQAFWRQQLSGAATLDLPTDRPRPAVQTFRGAKLRFELPAGLTERLRAAGRRHGATPFMTLLAAFQTLLGRYSGQDDIVVGTPVAGRNHLEIEGLIGLFVNTLVLRGDLSGNPTFEELLRRTVKVATAAYAHQELPFEQLVDHLQPERDLSRNPLFQVMLILAVPQEAWNATDLEASAIELDMGTSKFDVTLHLADTPRGFKGFWEYNTDLFDTATIERMNGHFRILLEAIVADPRRPVRQLPLLTSDERHQVLATWNATETPYPNDIPVHRLVERQAERTPERIAVEMGDQTITYRELDERANQLAHYLRTRGVGPETLVGFCVDRSPEMLVGLLAILKAGGAYLPLDPEYPAARLGFMLDDSHAPLLLANRRHADRLREGGFSGQVVCLDTDADAIRRESCTALPSEVNGSNRVYVIYTSGSTGKPKGVEIEHHSLVNVLLFVQQQVGITENDVILGVTTLSFDIAAADMYLPLSVGARLVLADRETAADGHKLAMLLTDAGVTMLQVTPATWRMLVDSGWAGQPGLTMFSSGEALDKELAGELLRRGGQLWNLYGPTETTIWSTAGQVQTGFENISIGRPIANTRLYVLDAWRQPVPMGVPGELYIGGEGLARGYLHRPELTAERFVPDPFGERGARMYRTGDLVRYRPDRTLEFLGRLDHQVKLRGFRIEIGEIEAVLAQHPDVRQAVAAAREDRPGDKHLVAYLVPEGAQRPSPEGLRQFIKEQLPEYMVPAVFVMLETMPLTPNGKVDRKALPVLDHSRPELEREYVAPRTPVEQTLAEIWSTVLGIQRVGIHDPFFELGGHSLLAAQVISRIQEAFQIELPLRTLFEEPTVAGLAAQIEQVSREQTPAPSMIHADRSAELPLSLAQERLWFLDQLEPNRASYVIPTAVRLTGPLDAHLLERSLQEVVTRHESLRTTFTSSDGRPQQRIAPMWEIRMSVIDLESFAAADREVEVVRLAEEEASQPFDLMTGPLVRASLLRLGPEEHVFLLTMHHIVSDGWSMGVLIKEIVAIYEAMLAGRPSPLTPLPIQYADYAAWQRGWLAGDVLDKQRDYWKRQLDRAPDGLELPTDYPPPILPDYAAGHASIVLSRAVTQRLTELSRHHDVTLFSTLLTAFDVLMRRLTGQEDIVVGTPVAGRNRAEIEGLVGFFVNTLVLRADVSGNPAFGELLTRVHRTAVEAYAHQDVPFEQLVQDLAPDRSLGRNPMFNVLINFASFFYTQRPEWDVGTLHAKAFVNPDQHSRFPMTLYVLNEPEIRLRLVYQRALFSSERIVCLLQSLRYLLEQIAAEPDRSVLSYSLISPEVRSRLPDPAEPLAEPEQEPVTTTFARQVRQRPEHAAVRQGDREWTYAELAERATTLARAIRARGVQPGETVALYGPRSLGLIVGMLAIPQSGAVLVPIDRQLPRSRREAMLREAAVRRMVCVGQGSPDGESWWQDVIPAEEVLWISEEDGRARDPRATETDEVSLPEIRPDAPAYVFFTSGSTAAPKGILGCHRGLSHFLQWQRTTFGIGPDDRVAQLTPYSFDVVLRDVFLPLTSGATLCLPDDDEIPATGEVLDWLERQRITVLHAVPSLARFWLTKTDSDHPRPAIRWVFFAGEPLTDGLVRHWRAVFPGSRIVNLYGPTETTLAKCFFEVPDDPLPGVQPVGHPLPQTQSLVMRDDQLCGIGEPGEIFLRTPFRTLGYLRPEANQGRFVRNPYRDDPADLVYRTGDRGRYRPDGTLEILGRIDDQVKIRGVRVEPSEVAAVLERHPAVQAAAVIAAKEEEGEAFLAAYVVPADGTRVETDTLRAHLAARLPSAFVPGSFVFLDRLPLLPNGKIDRRALPPARREEEPVARPYVAPRTPVEHSLAAIWGEVLGVEKVGVLDNFFDLGGHSLLAAQMVSRIRKELAVDLPLVELFATPTIAALAERIEAIRPSDDEPRQLRGGRFPLSYAQQRFWLQDQVRPGNPIYNILLPVRVSGPIDMDALKRTLHEMVARHETLRTTFPVYDGQPVQEVAASAKADIRMVDLREWPEPERQTEMQRLLREEAQRPCDLARGPLFRVSVLQLADDEHVLILMIHHIISDAWSIRVLMREVAAIYASFRQRRPSPLPELSLQYADYAIRQRELLEGDELERLLTFWRGQLAGSVPLELPMDRPRAAAVVGRSASQSFMLPQALRTTLHAVSRREGVTPFMVLVATFAVLLRRWSRQDDLLFGSTKANRNRPGVEGLIGFFVNILPLRVNLAGNPSFRELLERVRRMTISAFEHDELPFDRLIEDLRPPREAGRNPLFQVLINYPRGAASEPELLPGLKMATVGKEDQNYHLLAAENEAGPFDLSLMLLEMQATLRGSISYNTGLFDASSIARMLRQFRILLEAALADPSRPIDDLPWIDERERHRVLIEWNQTSAEYPRSVCLHELIEAQVERTPQSCAVVHDGRPLGYRELNEQANQLAHHLRGFGVGPESRVAIRMERCVEMVVGLIGVLKAGAAYVPLDPQLPLDRLRFMLDDARPEVILTQSRLLADLPETAARAVCLDSPWTGIGSAAHNPEPVAKADNLAAVIYTSGSTGRPKGVMLEHRALVNYVLAASEQYELAASDRVLQFASIGFDAHMEEIYPCLTRGGTVVLRTDGMLDSYAGFLRACGEWGVTVASLPTAFWHELTGAMEAEGLHTPPALRLVILGGETAIPERVAAWIKRVGVGVRLLNTYGPTETTVIATVHEAQDPTFAQNVLLPVPIGRPLRNVRTYVLDGSRQPVSVGVPGELYIAGDGLARGYWNQPELTAERFLADPFAQQPGERMYRTGDRARWRSDGQLEFLGRTDRQIKIRGYRVEPEEIEAVLSEYPKLREAAVIASGDPAGTARLVAYVVPHQEPGPSPAELRAFLGQRLPHYMIPAEIVTLRWLPKTVGGKVDRDALPAPDAAQSDMAAEYVAPRTPLEEKLASLWAGVLRVDRVGVLDNFFDLGGHSLLAVQLAAQVRHAFSAELPLAELFAAPTVAALARLIETRVPADGTTRIEPADQTASLERVPSVGQMRSPLVQMRPDGPRRPFFCVHGLGGLPGFLSGLAGQFDSDRAFYAFQAQGLDGRVTPHERIEDMAACYLDAIRNVQPNGPYLLGGWSMGGLVAAEMARQLAIQDAAVALLVLLDTPLPGGERSLLDDAGVLRWIASQWGFPLDEIPETSTQPWPLVLNWAQAVGLLPEGIDLGDVEHLVETAKAHYRALGSYQPQPFTGKAVLFRAQAGLASESNGQGNGIGPGPTWRQFLPQLETYEVPGTHVSMLRPPRVAVLAEQLQWCFERVEAMDLQESWR